jgi:protein-L-isoaspartate(D-aspartate) O-methyltransferase
MEKLVADLKQKGVLRSKDIENALLKIDRAYFIPEDLKTYAYADTALPIGYGQTISQPYTVVFMLEHLDVQKGMNVLEIGYGSGWQTALLADLVGPSGAVYSMEIIPELCTFGKVNISKFNDLDKRVEFYCKNASGGLPEVSESIGGFDRIICAAEVQDVPLSWREQLKMLGVMIYPKKKSLYKETKIDKNKFDIAHFEGFAFVPFVNGS